MTDSELIDTLLSLGLADRYDDVRKLPGAGDHSSVCRFSAEVRKKLNHFFNALDSAGRSTLAKAVSVYEDSVGGLGSVTLLRGLIENSQDSDRSLLDWILKNTRSYSYYSGGAKSIEEYEQILAIAKSQREENFRKESVRQNEAKKKRAARATHNLSNAVRRGDINAVIGLLEQGADPSVSTVGDMTLIEFAEAQGQDEISSKLKQRVSGD